MVFSRLSVTPLRGAPVLSSIPISNIPNLHQRQTWDLKFWPIAMTDQIVVRMASDEEASEELHSVSFIRWQGLLSALEQQAFKA